MKLARFDGVNLEEFASTLFAPTPNRGFRASAPSRDGGLWLAGDMGAIVHVNSSSSQTYLPSPSATELVVQTLLEDHEGWLRIVYRGGSIARLIDGHIVQ